MARYIDADELIEEIKSLSVFLGGVNLLEKTAKESVLRLIDEQPTANVVEVKDCNLCINNQRHATEYPCSHCKNCYTDKFKPIADGESK